MREGVAGLVCALALCGCRAGAPGAAKAPPRVSPLVGAPPLDAVYFVTEKNGWLGGDNVIYATSDGGRGWSQQYAGPAYITHLVFADARHGWALAKDRLLKTEDGGTNWVEAGGRAAEMTALDFVTPLRGFSASRGALYATADGGRTWSAAQTPAPVESVSFAGEQAGWAAGGAKVLHSADGGKTWRLVFTAPVQGQDWHARIRANGAQEAWLLLEGSGGFAVYHGTGTGADWQPGPRNLGARPGPFAVVPPATAYFLGFDPVTLARTFDDGQTWSQATPAVHPGELPDGTSSAADLSFPDVNHGWMVGTREQHGRVLATGDGGRTWRVVRP